MSADSPDGSSPGGLAAGGSGRRRRRDLRWTNRDRATFVAVLAEHYDYQAAMAAANLTWPEVCELRVRHPDFAVRIDEVIAAGFDRIELTLLRLASEALTKAAPDVPFVQAIMKLRRPARATGPVKLNTKAEAERVKTVERMMSKFTGLQTGHEGFGHEGFGHEGFGHDGAGHEGVGREGSGDGNEASGQTGERGGGHERMHGFG